MLQALNRQSTAHARATASGEAAGAFACLAGAVGYATLLVGGQKLLNDPDTLWHIAAGRWIRAHHAVPTTDIFSHTVPGAPWTAHEWLAESMLAGTYDQFGWTGVVMLAALAGGIALGLLAHALSRFIAPRFVAAVVAFSFVLAASHMTARPHLLAMPLMVAWATGLVQARTEDRAPSYWLLPAMALWANLHGGFIVGLGLAGALALEAIGSAEAAERRRAFAAWAAFLISAALVSLATPQGIEGWLFPFRLMGMGHALGYVTEWHAPDYGRLQPVEVWLFGLAVVLAVLRPRLPVLRAVLVAGLAYMALTQVRNAELLAMIAPLLLAPAIGSRLERPQPETSVVGARLSIGAAALVVAASLAGIAHGYSEGGSKIVPAAALKAAQAAHVTGPVFNDYDFGGYLIFAGVPVFIDGRVDVYGDAFTSAFMAARANEGGALPRLLDRYRIGWTLLAPDSAAAKALDRMKGWTRVYGDATAVVHRRVTSD